VKPAAKPAAKAPAKAAPKPAPKTTTKTTSKTTTLTSTATVVTAPEARVVQLVNAQRARVGCRPLVVNSALTRAARAHSLDMARKNYFSHTSLDGRTAVQRMKAAGFSGRMWGENIAAGQTTADRVMTAWMNSPGHKANILNCGYRYIGVGYATGGYYKHYWTQDFGA
jgi:uncharacterized protein YkwD